MSGAICRVCSLENAQGARFCSACGASLTAEQSGDPLVNRTIAGKYRVERLLGNGAMGRVYRAVHVALDRAVAIKVMHDHLAQSGEFATRFVREARSASRLDHPNSIRVLDFGRADQSEGGVLYLVMELFEGTDLYGLLRDEGPLDLPRGANIIGQVLSALGEAHAQRLIHRDLKPENVLVGRRPDGTEIAKLCDFGIAKIAQEQGPKLSQIGTMIGTPLYMSPEAACGRETDARSDLYSVGVMLYEVAAGSRPFDAPSPLELARRHFEEKPQPPTLRAPERKIPSSLERVILKALEKVPADRWQRAQEFKDALDLASSGKPAVAAVAQPIETAPCRTCGAPVPVRSRFCATCGAPCRTSSIQSAAPAPGESSQPEKGDPKSFATLAGILPDRLLGDLRRATQESRSERRALAALAIDLDSPDERGDPEELAGRIGDRFELVSRVLTGFDVVVQGGGGTRVTAVFGLRATAEETEGVVAKAVEAAVAVRSEASGAQWFKAGVAYGVFLITPVASGPPTVLGTAAQTAGRHAELARPGEVLLDESIRGRIGEGFIAVPARGGLFAVREDPDSVAGASAPGAGLSTQVARAVVGREPELDSIVAAASRALDGGGQVIAIRGEPGVGKTTLVKEAIARMRELPIRWYRVACRPTGAASLGAFRDLVLAYGGVSRATPPEVVRQSMIGDRGTLATLGLAPSDQQQLVGLLLGTPNATSYVRPRSGGATLLGGNPMNPEVAQREGSAAIRNFLAAALRKGNVGFVVEDLQWIDAASAAILAQLATAIAKRPAVIVLTARAGIWSEWNAPHFTRLHLGPLGPDTARRLVATLLPEGEVSDAVAEPILQRAGGNPLFLVSIVEALRASGGLALRMGAYSLTSDARIVAQGLRGLVEARLRALDAERQRTLLVAAVIGNEVDMSDLEAIVGRDVDVEGTVRELIGRGLLEERARNELGGRRIGFANEGVREVLYDTISLAERRTTHAAVAERWEAIRAATRSDAVPLEELARHWELAGHAEPATARLQEAASRLLARGEAKAAVALLRRAVAHAPALGPGGAARVMVRLAEALAQIGDLPGVEAAVAGTASLELDAGARLVIAAIGDRARGVANRRGGRPSAAAVVLQRALDRALEARDLDLACDLYLELSASHEEANETQKALQCALEGLEIASALIDRARGEPDTAKWRPETPDERIVATDDSTLRVRLASFLNAIGRLYLRRDDAVRAADYFRGSLAQAERVRDAAAAARALANLGHIAARRDDFRAAAAESSRALRLAQESGDRMSQARIHVNLGHYLARLKRRDEAEESYRAAQALSEAIGWSEGVAVAHQSLESLTQEA